MNEASFRQLFPRASRSTIEANVEPEREEPMRGGSKKCPKWTIVEDATLMEGFNQGLPIEQIATGIGKSYAATACRSGELKLKHPVGRGKYPRPAKSPPQARKIYDRSAVMSSWHENNTHPLKGRPVSNETRQKISEANLGRTIPAEQVESMLRTKYEKYGTVAPKIPHGSWKAGWRTIGMQRIYARSRWEANYARYLEFQKLWGVIADWAHEPETFWFEKIKRGCRSYLPDFRITNNDGSVEYHEVKGWMDDRSKTKIRRMAKYHPTVVLIVRDGKWFSANRMKLRLCIPEWEEGK